MPEKLPGVTSSAGCETPGVAAKDKIEKAIKISKLNKKPNTKDSLFETLNPFFIFKY
jgi:hypothetical protein